MLKTNDIKNLLLEELKNNNIKDTGYDCVNGTQYVDIRNIIFEVDKPYIFENIVPIKERMDENWYIEFYEPLINNQLEGLINKVIENPLTRHAILILPRPDLYVRNDFPCTIYIHLFLDRINDNEYNIEYSVHMRSNDSIDFISDVKWNNKIFNKIITEIYNKTNWKINKKNMIWNVDSIQLYSKYFNKV